MLDFQIIAPLSPQVISTLIVVFVLSLIFIIVGFKVSKLKPTDTPKGFVFVVVYFFEMIQNMIKENFPGKKLHVFGPYLFSVFVFLLFANTIALFGLTAPLSNITVAMSFSIMTFLILKVTELRYKGIKKKLHNVFIGQVWWLFPIMIPINLIGEVSTPMTMGIRLFGNLLSGAVISAMVYAFLHWAVGIFAGVFLHAVFDIFFGVIQAYVFFLLSSVNISMAAEA